MADQIDSIQFNEINAASIYTELIQSLEKEVGDPLYPGDERRIFGEAVVVVFVQLLNVMNDTARQKMLRHARGVVLDALGERTKTPRLDPSPAKTTMRFYVAAPLKFNVIIPQGTKVTPDSTLYFATQSAVVLQAGANCVDVSTMALEGGSKYNGYAPGTITTLVDLIPFIDHIENVTVSSAGDDGEPYTTAGDDRYRERIRISPSKFSTAGPIGAYEYWAYTADPDIVSVKVITPEPGVVTIIPLMKRGQLPDATVLKKVLDTASADTIRPLTDLVRAEAPTQVLYDICIKYYTTAQDEAAVIEAVEGADGAIARFNEWQTSALGCDINPDRLRKLILSPDWKDGLKGALRLDVIAPTFKELDEISVATFSGIWNVTHQVVKE